MLSSTFLSNGLCRLFTDAVLDTNVNWWHLTVTQNGCCKKGPLEVIWSHLLLRQGHLESVVQDHVPEVFEHLQGWTLHSLSGQSSCLWPLSLGTTEKNLTPTFMHPPFRYLYVFIRPPLTLVFSNLESHSSQSFLMEEMLQSLLAIILLMQS